MKTEKAYNSAKTAYSPMYKETVQILNVRHASRGLTIFNCVMADGSKIIFRERELRDIK